MRSSGVFPVGKIAVSDVQDVMCQVILDMQMLNWKRKSPWKTQYNIQMTGSLIVCQITLSQLELTKTKGTNSAKPRSMQQDSS